MPNRRDSDPKLLLSFGYMELPSISDTISKFRNATTVDQLAFLGGICAMTAIGVLEWPIALAVGVGHLLASQHGPLHGLGEALEAA